MGHAAAEAVVRAGLTLVPVTLSGYSAGVAVANIGVAGVPVELVGKERRQEALDRVKAEYPGLVIVDYTMPNCVNDNAEFYARNGVPFVMGTTGGDRAAVAAAAEAAGVYAVVAPQMGKQVVAFQAMMALMAESFPGAFSGYTLDVVESHQRNKADVSGTAKAVVASLQKLGVEGFKDVRFGFLFLLLAFGWLAGVGVVGRFASCVVCA
jgi:4-hydroxy-tetrahydrodipicolinate reductase